MSQCPPKNYFLHTSQLAPLHHTLLHAFTRFNEFSLFLFSFFCSGNHLALSSDPGGGNCHIYINESPINEETLIRVCGGIKTSNGSGVDCISSFFLKIGISVLAPSLVQLFNLSLSLGRFPDSWKMARVAPIFFRDALLTLLFISLFYFERKFLFLATIISWSPCEQLCHAIKCSGKWRLDKMKDQTVKVAVAITERLFQDGIGHLVGHGLRAA